MPERPLTDQAQDEQFDAILVRISLAQAGGCEPDWEYYLARFPALAPRLLAHFANRERPERPISDSAATPGTEEPEPARASDEPARPEPAGESRPAAAVPALVAFDQLLKTTAPCLPVTALVVGLNVVVFALMVVRYGCWLHFRADALVDWGACHGIKSFAGEWWRVPSSVFLHLGFGHLSGNLLFLLLIAPLVERLLGSVRFAAVYLFAGIGAALLDMGWYPSRPACGASGAIYGTYGAFLGCYLRGLRTIPARIFFRSVGLLLLYTALNLVQEYLEFGAAFIAHLGGFLFGLAGGLLFGHVLHPTYFWIRVLVVEFAIGLCLVLLFATTWAVRECCRLPILILKPHDAAFDQERRLVARFDEALDRWQDGEIKDADLQRLLQLDLIPAWERLRTDRKLLNEPELEQHPLSLRELLDGQTRPKSEPAKGRSKDQHPLTDKEFDSLFRMYLKLRADNWRGLAAGLKDDSPHVALLLMEERLIAALRHQLDEMANEQNPLSRWPKSRRQRREERN
jgi:rhomboid protease GluP